ncbi:MAG: TolC family protein [Chloroherpetonaceae bacterium]|nr:TolC family protein [Chloroherpetonaceae bacterium]
MRLQLQFRFTLWIMLVLTASFELQSQTRPYQEIVSKSDRMTVDSLVIAAYKNSYLLEGLREGITVAEEKTFQESMHWLSNLRFGVQFLNLPTNPDYNGGSIIPTLGVNISLDLEGLVTLPSRISGAEAGKRVIENELLKQKRILRTWVESKYFDYLQSLELLKLQYAILESQEEQMKLVKARFEGGESKIEDYLLIQNAIAQTKQAIVRAEIEAKRIERELAIATNEKENLNGLMER